MPCRTGVGGWLVVIRYPARDRHPADRDAPHRDGTRRCANKQGRLDAALLDAHARRQAREKPAGPEAVEPRRASAGAEAILVGRLDQTAALDQAAKILLV